MSRTRVPLNYPWAIGTTNTKGTRIFGNRSLALYPRTDGKMSVVTDICPHRGAKLSSGTRVNGCIVCPYHGYMFDERGHVIKTNHESDCKLQVHTTTELYNLVWISSDKYCPPIYPELQDDTWNKYEGSMEVRGNWIDWIANLTEFSGNIKEDEDRIMCENINGICEFIFPNTVVVKTHDNVIKYTTITPVSQNKTRLSWCYAHKEKDNPTNQLIKKIREDERIISDVPEHFPLMFHVPVDEYQLKVINKLNDSVLDKDYNTFILI